MKIKILLTSDNHLGLRFADYPAEVKEILVNARYQNLKNIVALANDKACDLFVIAGDMFDRTSISREQVQQAIFILQGFAGKALLFLPGNHDYVNPGPGGIWSIVKELSRESWRILDQPTKYDLSDLGLPLTIYAGPCVSKHSERNAIDWIQHSPKNNDKGLHIGIAHGTLMGLAADLQGNYYSMSRNELEQSGMDLWLLGHIHLPYPANENIGERIFYAGTPEPDGFDCRHNGSVWLLNMDSESKELQAERIQSGLHRFIRLESKLNCRADLEQLEKNLNSMISPNCLLRLYLSGRLMEQDFEYAESIRQRLKQEILHLDWRDEQLRRAISRQDIDSLYTAESFPHRLLMALAEDDADALALQEAYEMLQECKV